jgi:uncharacterized protein YjbJ (UPF0337 family)
MFPQQVHEDFENARIKREEEARASAEKKSQESDPSRMSAMKDTYVGSMKETVGSMLSENMQREGAEQKLQGEKDSRSIHEAEDKSFPNMDMPQEPSRWTAVKDTVVGATKEVIGAVFNENLQNSGAQQRIHGERELRAVERTEDELLPNMPVPSEPSKLNAIKDQVVGSTKELMGAIFSSNLQHSGVEQRIHGEREYETALMAEESQARQDKAFDNLRDAWTNKNQDKPAENLKEPPADWNKNKQAEGQEDTAKRLVNA